MRINTIQDKKSDVTLDTGDLICIANALYFYEKHWQDDDAASRPGETFHDLAKQICTARDLCQYGHMDGHSLKTVLHHELAARPEGSLAVRLRKAAENDGNNNNMT